MSAIETSRRSFLRGILALGAASVVVKPAMLLGPRLVGDGIHDDTAGLSALFAGQPVDCVSDFVRVIQGEHIVLRNGLFRTTAPIKIQRDHTIIEGCEFNAQHDGFAFIVEANHAYVKDLILVRPFKPLIAGHNIWIG